MLAALLIAPGANAAQPTVFTIDIVFDDPNTQANEGSEVFHSDGSVICATGSAVTDPVFVAGFGRQGRGNGTFHLEKTLTCTRVVNRQTIVIGTVRIAVDAAGTKTGTIGGWTVRDGTGEYSGITGGGQIVGLGDPGSGLDLRDYYTGRLTN
jgi:hypothetical protein